MNPIATPHLYVDDLPLAVTQELTSWSCRSGCTARCHRSNSWSEERVRVVDVRGSRRCCPSSGGPQLHPRLRTTHSGDDVVREGRDEAQRRRWKRLPQESRPLGDQT